ncbi:MAG: hypothetical protein ACRYFX_00920 [Janthinobacterium lividum]
MTGSNNSLAPAILQLQSTCSVPGGQSLITFTCDKRTGAVHCTLQLTDQASGSVIWSDGFGTGYAKFFTLTGAPDGTYTLTVTAGGDQTSCTIVVACGNGAAAPLTATVAHTDETAAYSDGTIEFTTAGGGDPLYLEVVELNLIRQTTAGTPETFRNLPPGTYTTRVTDSSLPTQLVLDSVTIAAYSLGGCTDKLATNYDAAATVENGSCVYTPPALPDFFAVPLLQTLRFVVRGGGSTADEVLFCEQARPGIQVRPLFYQSVENTDTVRVQVLTSSGTVTATISHHGGSAVGPPVTLQQVLTLEGPAAPLGVVLSLDPATGTTRLSAAAGGSLPASLLGAARLTLAGAASGTWRITQAVPGTVLHLPDYVIVNRPWAAPAAGALTATWRITGAGFNVWEADLPVAALSEGYYQVQLRAVNPSGPDSVADSEPLHVRAVHPHTLAIDYTNADNCFGLVFSTGLMPRLRVPGTFFRQKNGGTESAYRDSGGRLTVLSSTAQRLLQLETYALPPWLHEKLYLACRLDYLRVEGVRCQTDQAYEVSEERTYALSAGRVALEQVQWLGAGNGNDAGVDGLGNVLELHDGQYLLLRGK